MTGTAHVSVSHEYYERLLAAQAAEPTLFSIRSASDFGDGSMLMVIESRFLPYGYHGMQCAILSEDGTALSFKPDGDV
jgi:hypothetical protein